MDSPPGTRRWAEPRRPLRTGLEIEAAPDADGVGALAVDERTRRRPQSPPLEGGQADAEPQSRMATDPVDAVHPGEGPLEGEPLPAGDGPALEEVRQVGGEGPDALGEGHVPLGSGEKLPCLGPTAARIGLVLEERLDLEDEGPHGNRPERLLEALDPIPHEGGVGRHLHGVGDALLAEFVAELEKEAMFPLVVHVLEDCTSRQAPPRHEALRRPAALDPTQLRLMGIDEVQRAVNRPDSSSHTGPSSRKSRVVTSPRATGRSSAKKVQA